MMLFTSKLNYLKLKIPEKKGEPDYEIHRIDKDYYVFYCFYIYLPPNSILSTYF